MSIHVYLKRLQASVNFRVFVAYIFGHFGIDFKLDKSSWCKALFPADSMDTHYR